MKIKVKLLIGGTNVRTDINEINDGGIQIIVGTPGRVRDMIHRGILKTDFLRMIVLDEADEIFYRGFIEEVNGIFMNLPADDVQVYLFSATIPQELIEITQKIIKDPLKYFLSIKS